MLQYHHVLLEYSAQVPEAVVGDGGQRLCAVELDTLTTSSGFSMTGLSDTRLLKHSNVIGVIPHGT